MSFTPQCELDALKQYRTNLGWTLGLRYKVKQEDLPILLEVRHRIGTYTKQHSYYGLCHEFTPEGRYLLTAISDNEVVLVELPKKRRTAFRIPEDPMSAPEPEGRARCWW